MNVKLINELKKNERPFGLLSKEEQECLRSIPKLLCYQSTGNWLEIKPEYFIETTYCIPPDYQPEPEFVKTKIELSKSIPQKLVIYYYGERLLHEITSMPDFDHFELQHGGHIQPHGIAPAIRDGAEVYAVFVKE